MLDVIGSILVGASMAAILTSVVTTAPLRMSDRLVVAVVTGAWVGLAGAIAGAGALSQPAAVLIMFAAPLVMTVATILAFPRVRRAIDGIPLPTLVGLNVVRLGGILFVLLAFTGRLSGPFPYFAGWGDVITGAWAIPTAWLAMHGTSSRGRAVLAWNIFGMLDLIVAVSLGLISRDGSPLQIIHAGVGTAAMQTLPWVFIPTTLVPFFLVVHGIIFARMWGVSRTGATDPSRSPTLVVRSDGQAA